VAELFGAEDLQVDPDYHMFGIGEDPAGFGEAPPVPGAGWLGVGHASVLIGVAEDMVRPSLRLEHWDGEPPSTPPGHDVQQTLSLQLPTGMIGLDQITRGGMPVNLGLVPGQYAVRITGWGRESTERAFADLAAGSLDWTDPEFTARRDALDGQERYLVQFWLQSPSAALVQSAGCLIHSGYDRFAIVDAQAGIRRVPAAGPDWLTIDDSGPLIQIRYREGRPVVRLELWDGPPPASSGPAFQVREPIRLSLPSGRLKVLHLPPGEAGIKEIHNGMVPLAVLPPGDYHVLLSRRWDGDHDGVPRYLVRLWPADASHGARVDQGWAGKS
jgi:hypothetical protein